MADRSIKRGLGPGSLVHIGRARTGKVRIRVMDYDHASLEERDLADLDACSTYLSKDSITWIDVDGIHDPAIVQGIGERFGIHVLMLEDIMNTSSRPKVEFTDDYMFITLKMIDIDEKHAQISVEQFSMVVGPNYLITFQEIPGDSFHPVRERIRTSKGRVRTKDAHYLAYLLLDVIVDNYIAVSEKYADQIEELEAAVLRKPTEFTLHRILAMRKDLLDFKRSIDPLKEAVNYIQREVDENISKYYRDLYDHIIYESENLAMYREMLVNLLDLYHSSLSFRMNSIMKVLTIMTTIFVPLTFIVGVYGMNFDRMPELHLPYGYPMVMGFMAILVACMLLYFRRRKWL